MKTCHMVMIKLVRKEGAKYVKNYFMFLKLVNIVLNVLGNYQNHKIKKYFPIQEITLMDRMGFEPMTFAGKFPYAV